MMPEERYRLGLGPLELVDDRAQLWHNLLLEVRPPVRLRPICIGEAYSFARFQVARDRPGRFIIFSSETRATTARPM